MLKVIFDFLRFLITNRGHLTDLRVQSYDGTFAISRTDIEPSSFKKNFPKASVGSLEDDIDVFWRSVPFHTLFLIYGLPVQNSLFGGTCTDRAILFYQRVQEKYGPSLDIRLHRASIKDRETHTVLLIQLDQKTYLIDVGSNWPVMRMVPCFQNISFESFGISFRSLVDDSSLVIQMRKSGEDEFRPFLQLDLTYQAEAYVNGQISNRFSEENELPFSTSLRYAFVYEDIFYVIRHDGIIDMNSHDFISCYKSMGDGTSARSRQ